MRDATCPDTFTVSYRVRATSGAGKVAELAEEMIYSHLIPTYFFIPVSVKSSGAIGPSSMAFLKELVRR